MCVVLSNVYYSLVGFFVSHCSAKLEKLKPSFEFSVLKVQVYGVLSTDPLKLFVSQLGNVQI